MVFHQKRYTIPVSSGLALATRRPRYQLWYGLPFSSHARQPLNVNQITIDQLPMFHATLGALLKSSMNTMRKRDKKRERLKSDKIAARKKRLQEPINVTGSKRGSGRRKRQRLLKAVQKREMTVRRQEEKERLRARQSLNDSR
jgi:hypothetical protein